MATPISRYYTLLYWYYHSYLNIELNGDNFEVSNPLTRNKELKGLRG
jgi:hypothetical protein